MADKKLRVYSTAMPISVQVPTVDTIINLSNNSYLTVQGLDLRGANNGFKVAGSQNEHHITISDCYFNNLSDGIFAYPNVPYLSITNCYFNECNNRAINGGASAGMFVSDCSINKTGHLIGMGGNGDTAYTAIVATGDSCQILNNRITYTGFIPIRFDGHSTLIDKNFINYHNYVKDEGAGIYCYPNINGPGPNSYTTRTLSNNIVLNAIGAISGGTPAGTSSRANGIYADGTSPNITFVNNTIAFCSNIGLFLDGSHDTWAIGNNFFDCSKHYALVNSLTTVGIGNNKVENNIATAKSGQFTVYADPQTRTVANGGAALIPTDFYAANNIWARPILDTGVISRIQGASTITNTIAQWQTYLTSAGVVTGGRDAGTVGSPMAITNDNQIKFEYNDTLIPKTISLGAVVYKDMKNVSQTGNITLQPMTSITLLSPPVVKLIIIHGEDNAAGLGDNSNATSPELAIRPEVKIFNNTTLTFQSIDVGTNNNLGQGGGSTTTNHGLELGLTNEAVAGNLGTTPIYLVKCGKHGSKIEDWLSGQAYWTEAQTRIDAAINAIVALGFAYDITVWQSIGFNDWTAYDSIGVVGINDWITRMATFRNLFRAKYGEHIPFIMTNFSETQSGFSSSWNTAIQQVSNGDTPSGKLVDISDFTSTQYSDTSHWNYAGLKIVATRMVSA